MREQLNFNKRLLKRIYLIFVILLFVFALAIWQRSQMRRLPLPTMIQPSAIEVMVINEPIQPIPLSILLDEKKVALGDKLFHERQLSHYNNISCASCHNLATGGVDRVVFSTGSKGLKVLVNTPTVFNSGFNFKQNWNGNIESLEEQIEKGIHRIESMASNWPEIIDKLKKSPEYIKAFGKIYSDGITSGNIKDALATFERSLFTPDSRFDRFLRGNSQAITAEEKEGYRLFKSYGCISCHQGVNVGGNLFQKFGIVGDYFGDRGNITQSDLGRFNVTGDEEDRYVFKVPTLRNIILTSPYFHDGSATTLEEAVAVMGKYQLGRIIPQKNSELIINFLKTLTGNYRGNSL